MRGKKLRVERTSRSHLWTVSFEVNGHRYEAIEQNPEKPSQWGKLARIGHQVVQFKDSENKHVRRGRGGWEGHRVRQEETQQNTLRAPGTSKRQVPACVRFELGAG